MKDVQSDNVRSKHSSWAINIATAAIGGVLAFVLFEGVEALQRQIFAPKSANLFFYTGLQAYVFYGILLTSFWVRIAVERYQAKKDPPFIIPLIAVLLLALAVDSFFNYRYLDAHGLDIRQGFFNFHHLPAEQIDQIRIVYGEGNGDYIKLKEKSGKTMILSSSDSSNYFNQIVSVDQMLASSRIHLKRIGSPLMDHDEISDAEIDRFYSYKVDQAKKQLSKESANLKKDSASIKKELGKNKNESDWKNWGK